MKNNTNVEMSLIKRIAINMFRLSYTYHWTNKKHGTTIDDIVKVHDLCIEKDYVITDLIKQLNDMGDKQRLSHFMAYFDAITRKPYVFFMKDDEVFKIAGLFRYMREINVMF